MISVETVLVVLDSTCVFLDQGLIGLSFFFFFSAVCLVKDMTAECESRPLVVQA